MSIDGKVVLVTGAGQGIGRAIALRLARDGAHIAVVDINDSKTGAVASEVRGIGRKATTFKADVTKREDVYAAVDHAEKDSAGSTSWSTMPASLRCNRCWMSLRRKWTRF